MCDRCGLGKASFSKGLEPDPWGYNPGYRSFYPQAYPQLDAKGTEDIVYIADSPKPPPERLTFTFRAFKRYAKGAKVYLLFFGEGKRVAYERFLEGRESPSTLPALYFPREWFNFEIITDLEEK